MTSSGVRAAAFAALLLAQACNGPSIGHEGADDYFREHRAALEQVVEEVSLCQPPSGRIDRSSDFRCSSSRSPQNLKLAIARADARWIRVYYELENGRRAALTRVQIAVRSEGMAFAGVSEEFTFENTPALRAEYEREEIGRSVIERQPVTEPPHHWYWVKIVRRVE